METAVLTEIVETRVTMKTCETLEIVKTYEDSGNSSVD